MAGDSDKAIERSDAPAIKEKKGGPVGKKKQTGVFSRIWNGIFRIHGNDFEKRLQHISKEEAAILSRIRKRSQSWRGMARNLIVLSVFLEVVAVGYAVMTTRSLQLDWKIRALRVLPMFLLPGLSTIIYLALGSFTRMCDHKDQTNLERLRAERQERIDELKEKTNYYITQQLIQKYDTDPTAKAAAATVLASKLGADSGLKVYLGKESESILPAGKSNDVELVHSSGLHNRKHMLTRSNSTGSTIVQHTDEDVLCDARHMSSETTDYNQIITEHHQPGSTPHDGGWFARIAAMLVGEDPMQCYALICGNCHMHNGLARKEDFPYVTYYCPHCNALNRSNNLEDTSGFDPPSATSSITTNNANQAESGTVPMGNTKLVRTSSARAIIESVGESDVAVSGDRGSDSKK